NVVPTSVAHEALVQFRCERYAVNSGCVRDVANHLAGVRVDNDDVRIVRNVQATRCAVHRQIVPAAVTADFNFFQNLPARWRSERADREQGRQSQRDNSTHRSSFGFPRMVESYRKIWQTRIKSKLISVYLGKAGLSERTQSSPLPYNQA